VSKGGAQQDRLWLNGKLALAGGGRCVLEWRTQGATEPNPAPLVFQSQQLGWQCAVGDPESPGSTASGPKGKLLSDGPGTDRTAHDHCFFADSPEMPPSLLLLILGHHDCNSSTLAA